MSVRLAALMLLAATTAAAQDQPVRARALGVPFDGTPGRFDAITDVAGVTVGHSTIVRGEGRLRVGTGPVRTGVTAIFPRGRDNLAPVFAGWFSMNGNGEMTGTAWIEEYGLLVYPVAITNTNSVGTVRDAIIGWGSDRLVDASICCLPVVAETWDGDLNDIFGFHVHREHVEAALAAAAAGPGDRGKRGRRHRDDMPGLQGRHRHRQPPPSGEAGRLYGGRAGAVQLRPEAAAPNCGRARGPGDLGSRALLRHDREARLGTRPRPLPRRDGKVKEHGSIIVVVATDAPLLPHQLKRVAKRAALGIGRMGGIAGMGSGDLFLAFSTAPTGTGGPPRVADVKMLVDQAIDPVYEATVQATEEAITNAMVAARTMTGADGYRVPALPHEELRKVLARHGRLVH